MRKRLRSDFQLSIVTLFGFCSAAVISPFAVYRFLTGAVVVGILDATLVLTIVALVVYGWRTGRTEQTGKALVIINCAGTVLSSELLGVIGVFWMYAAILSNFFLTTSRRYAAAVTVATLLLLAILGKAFETSAQMWSFLATSALLALLSFIVAYQYEQQRRQLEVLATQDPLTGIQNRRVMAQELQRVVEGFRRSGGTPTLALLDIDHFKPINDQHGHDTGDAVLQAFARLVQHQTRQVDRFFRYGGEEFLLLLPDTSLDEAMTVAEKIRQQVATAMQAQQLPAITVSAGIAMLRPHENWQGWVSRADVALYRAKSKGRNRIEPDNGETTSDSA